MGYVGARSTLDQAISQTSDPGAKKLAEALKELSKAIEGDLHKLAGEVAYLKASIR
jgi:hypothetical protein